MKENSRLKDDLNKELWPNGQSSLRSAELRTKICEDFRVYFENEDMLRMAADTGFLIYDYNFFCKNFKNSIFEAFLLTIIEIYQAAKHINEEECFTFILAIEPTISRGFQNTTDIVYTEQYKNIERLNLYSKVCFRELGDFIEGSFQPFIKEVYGLHLLQKLSSADAVDRVKKAKFGDVVAALINSYEDLSVLYKHVLCGVTLNQWRNIAHHNSYVSNETTNEIKCTYGPKDNEQTIVLTREDLGRIFIGIHHIRYLHKIAHAIFVADNIIALSALRSNSEISEDTAIMQSFETLASRGFKVIDLKRLKSETLIQIQDVETRDSQEIEQTIKEIVPIVFSLLNRLSLHVFSDDGMLLFEYKSSSE